MRKHQERSKQNKFPTFLEEMVIYGGKHSLAIFLAKIYYGVTYVERANLSSNNLNLRIECIRPRFDKPPSFIRINLSGGNKPGEMRRNPSPICGQDLKLNKTNAINIPHDNVSTRIIGVN